MRKGLLLASIMLISIALSFNLASAECIFNITNDTGSVTTSYINLTDLCNSIVTLNNTLSNINASVTNISSRLNQLESNMNGNSTLLLTVNSTLSSLMSNLTVNGTNITVFVNNYNYTNYTINSTFATDFMDSYLTSINTFRSNLSQCQGNISIIKDAVNNISLFVSSMTEDYLKPSDISNISIQFSAMDIKIATVNASLSDRIISDTPASFNMLYVYIAIVIAMAGVVLYLLFGNKRQSVVRIGQA